MLSSGGWANATSFERSPRALALVVALDAEPKRPAMVTVEGGGGRVVSM